MDIQSLSLNSYIIAGPNGAGKTTFAREFLPNYAVCRNFINADLIAQGISPFSPEAASFRAGRLVLKVSRGGHGVPEADVRRRFDRSLKNFMLHYRPLADSWLLFDGSLRPPALIAFKEAGALRIIEQRIYRTISTQYGEVN